MARFRDEQDEIPVTFFHQDNPVTIKLYYDYDSEKFVAIATHPSTGTVITTEESEDEPADALEAIAGTLMLLVAKPELFNDTLKKIGEDASNPAPKSRHLKSV